MKAKVPKKLIMDFLLAGNAIVTFKSLATGKHFTYRIKAKKGADIWFVEVMYNYESKGFAYIGCIMPDGIFKHTKGSKMAKSSPSFKAFDWCWNNLTSDQLEIWHEGRCGRCGRLLTEPKSIACGFGPACKQLI